LARDIAIKADLVRKVIETERFKIVSYSKTKNAGINQLIHVYIEGDGLSWIKRNRISSNPTPLNPIGLTLAAQDKHDFVVYLARPCQYIDLLTEISCSQDYWSSHRYSETVIKSMNQALDSALGDISGTKRVSVIGFSGGGTVAALLAARRTDVVRLTTIASNLDHEAWAHYHSDSPLSGSLNALDIATDLSLLPQVHLVGQKDTNVPPLVLESYLNNLQDRRLVKIIIVPEADHSCCWSTNWNERFSDAWDSMPKIKP